MPQHHRSVTSPVADFRFRALVFAIFDSAHRSELVAYTLPSQAKWGAGRRQSKDIALTHLPHRSPLPDRDVRVTGANAARPLYPGSCPKHPRPSVRSSSMALLDRWKPCSMRVPPMQPTQRWCAILIRSTVELCTTKSSSTP